MQVGRTVRLRVPLHMRHAGIRFDSSQGSIEAPVAPRGASGEIRQLSHDRSEAMIVLAWDVSRYSFTYKMWKIWVKRAFLGSLFE